MLKIIFFSDEMNVDYILHRRTCYFIVTLKINERCL